MTRHCDPAPGAKHKVCFIVSAPITAEAFLAKPVAALGQHYEVHLVANGDPAALRHPALQRAAFHFVPIRREISLWADGRALARLVAVLHRERFSAIHSLTPKAGLLSALAGWIARVPVRLHTFTGQVWATRRGPARCGLKTLDRVLAALDTHVLVDSTSQRDFLRSQGVLAAGEGAVLGHGSVCGVDPQRFKPDPAARAAVRAQLAIRPDEVVFLFVGRLTREKGVLELARAFGTLAAARDDVHLVVVGPDEENMGEAMREACGAHVTRLHVTGQSNEPERYMAASDVFCLPSHREGFGAVIVEAAAAGLPAIGSRIYGITDAIRDGSTGLLVEARDVAALGAAMEELAASAPLRRALGVAARDRALRDFPDAAITDALVDYYVRIVPPAGAAQTQRP